jgi:hypothetical protein
VASDLEAFFAALDETFGRHAPVMDAVNGSILLQVFDTATRTIVTRGPRKGVHREATTDPVDCVLCCEPWVMSELLDPDAEPDLAELVEDGALIIEGDLQVLERFLAVAHPRSVLAHRASAKPLGRSRS